MEFKKFRMYRNNGHVTRLRIVNQEEIVNFVHNNPGKTENEIMSSLYNFKRGETWESNKKYADCLRRALRNPKWNLSRIRVNKKYDKSRFVYFVKND